MSEALHLFDRNPAPGKKAAAVLAVGMHVLLALFLVYGIRWQTEVPEAVEVELVRSGPANPQPSQEPVKEPTPKPEPVKEPPKPQPQPKEPPPKQAVKPDIAVKSPEKPKPEPKPQPADPMQEMLKREAEQLKKSHMSSAAASELAQMESSKAAAARNKGLADYAAKIRGKIRGNLLVPPGVSGNPEAEFMVKQFVTGEVHEVKVRKSSGNKALDEAIERAIYKSSPLPKPDDQRDFQPILELKFRPLESAPN